MHIVNNGSIGERVQVAPTNAPQHKLDNYLFTAKKHFFRQRAQCTLI